MPTPQAGLIEGTLTTTGGISNVALVSNTAVWANVIEIYHGSDNQTLTITGNEALQIIGVTPNAKVGDTIDASMFTQTLNLGAALGISGDIEGVKINTKGAGNTGKGDVVKLGSGTSYLAVSSAVIGDKITLLPSHTAVDTLDTNLIASTIAKTAYTSAAAQQADITQITNFNTNHDMLGINSRNGSASDLIGHTWTVTNGFVTGTGLTGATGLTAFLEDVAASKTFIAMDRLAYTDGTNTYIAIADHAAGTALGEHIIELVGVHTATALGGAGGAHTIWIA